jgi:hypothetical protein
MPQKHGSRGSWLLQGGQRKSQVSVLGNTDMMPIPTYLSTQRANSWMTSAFTKCTFMTCAHIWVPWQEIKKGTSGPEGVCCQLVSVGILLDSLLQLVYFVKLFLFCR